MGISPIGFTPFSGNIGPLTRVTPFTHRDNATYLSILQELVQYIQNTLTTDVNAELQRILDAFQVEVTGLGTTRTEWQTFFDQFIVDVTANIATLNDLAIRDLINGKISATFTAMDTLITERAVAMVAKTELDGLTAGKLGDVASGTRVALETILDGDKAEAAVITQTVKSAGGLEYNESFASRPDGAFTKALTGQDYSFLGPPITVTDGFASYPNTADGGAYASIRLDGNAVWLGGEFKMTPSVTDGGLVVFAMTEEDIKATQDAGEGLPRMSAHLCINATEITLDVCTTKGGAVTRLWSHQFAVPLLANDAAIYSAYICLNRNEGIAYVVDPLGEVHSIQHTGFQIPSPWVFFEPFRTLGTPSDKMRAKYRRVQADSRDTSRPGLLRPLARRQTITSSMDVYPSTYTQLALTTVQQPIPGTLTTVTVPSTGKVRARITAFIDITTTVGAVVFNVVNSVGTGVIAARTAGYKPEHSGWATVEMLIEEQVPGSVLTGQFSATALTGAAATLNYGNDNSLSRYNVSFTMEPVL